ncbi:MAG: Rpn family recombination-promoting nuclease/putative transposase [Rivularia sp. (in: cyanobacteria)]
MFDNVCKFLAENFSSDFATWLLGESITLTELSPKELSLEPIRADSIIFLQSDEKILHIEFQTQPDAKIPFRMIDYRVRGYRRFPHKEMHQVVIYLNRTNSELVYQNTFTLTRTRHEFEIIRLWEQPSEVFLANPGLLPFAVLSNTPNPENVLNQVAKQINGISDNRTQSNVAASTAILAGLVLNKELIKRVLRADIMRESPIYQEILQEGKAEGRAEGKAEVAINLLSTNMALEDISRVTGLSIEELRVLQRKRGEQ